MKQTQDGGNIVLDSSKLQQAQEDNPFIKITDAVYKILEEAILSSKLKPGSRLKINTIAEELQVSTSPVREAIEMLAAEGLLIEYQASGGKYKNYYVFDMANDDIEALFQARKSIEGLTAYICAEENCNIDLVKLKQYAIKFGTTLETNVKQLDVVTISKAAEFDRGFHKLIVDSANNRYMIEMYGAIAKNLGYLSIRTCEFVGAEGKNALHKMASQHISIYNAIKLGFPELARQEMERHIDFCVMSCLKNRKWISRKRK
jgi:DNA-binding GntR family transcriptional regulator